MGNKLYPLYYKGRLWQEEEVDSIFKAFYHSKMSLDNRTSVYVGEDLRRTPDGEWVE